MPKKKFTQDTIAFIYDFDGTLSPQPMQEYSVLPALGIKADEFWRQVNEEASKTTSDKMLTYMRLMLAKANEKQIHLGRQQFKELGRKVRYFNGVGTWFSRMNSYVTKKSRGHIKVKHYLISAGNKEILEGVAIRKHFAQIYASEYYFNHHDFAEFPKLLITDTSKTQFIFRINKGKEDLKESINEHMNEADRPVPFSNIIYIGDGDTDVPSMSVTKKSGGNTIAVYAPARHHASDGCKKLLKAGRVDFVAPADYRKGKELDTRVQLLLNSIMSNIEYQRELFRCKKQHQISV